MAECEQNHAYPDGAVDVFKFCYRSNLHLSRKIARVQSRRGKDAAYIVTKPYRAHVKIKWCKDGKTGCFPICVPKGYETDLCSSPRFARSIVGRVGPHLEASIVHDWLYEAWQGRWGNKRLKPNCDMRRFADAVFLEALKEAKVAGWKRMCMWLVVRVCGRKIFYT